jgi:hypothetical protein
VTEVDPMEIIEAFRALERSPIVFTSATVWQRGGRRSRASGRVTILRACCFPTAPTPRSP